MTSTPGTSRPQPLEGIVVADLSASVAGQFCGRLFADHGASVCLLEPTEGTATRRQPPFVPGEHGGPRSALFEHLNAGKHHALVDLGTTGGLDEAVRRTTGADVVILDGDDAALVELCRRADPAVTCQVTPFGTSGPWRSWAGNELVFQALSGVMFENGDPGRAPLYGMGHRASYAAGVIAFSESLALLLGGDPTHRVVDVAIAEVAASMNFCRATQYSYNQEIEGRDASTTPRAIVRCADGWASVFIYDHRWRQDCTSLGLGELADDPRFTDEQTRLAHWSEFTDELARLLAHRRVADVVESGQRDKTVVARALRPSELAADPQLLARGYWRWSEEDPSCLPRLGPMFGFSDTPQLDHGPAPTLDADPPETGGAPRPNPGELRGEPAVRGTLPLQGVTILDLTTAWSGPMTTRLLATLGATVWKVEGPSRIDLWRGPISGGLGSRYPDHDPGERPYNRCFQFNTQNHDKLGLALDLKHPEGLALALELAERADVLIANFRVGTLERMGLSFEELHRRNPGLILLEMPAYGAGGPMSDYVALGPSMELMSAMATCIGYGDGRPVTTGPAYLDPLGGLNACAGILVALAAKRRSGIGQRVELAQREAAMQWIGEEIIAAVATGIDPEPKGNRLAGVVPHGAFACRGEDEWVVLCARGDAEFHALLDAMGMRELASDPRFSTLAARTEREDELEARITSWTSTRDKHEIAESLQVAGVPAAPVCNAEDLAASPFLEARGLLQDLTHPEAGTHRYQGVPLHIGGLDLEMGRPAPLFGEHTIAVLAALGTHGPEELERLVELGAIATPATVPSASA